MWIPDYILSLRSRQSITRRNSMDDSYVAYENGCVLLRHRNSMNQREHGTQAGIWFTPSMPVR